MKKIYLLLALIIAMSTNVANAQIGVASWNFNSSNTNASTGVGVLSFVGGTGSPSYINNAGTQALAFADFPLINVGSGTAGIQFATSTSGYTGISVTFDTYGHNQSSKWQQYEYTTNGSSWTILSNNAGGLTSGFLPKTLNFPASCDNNPNFAFRVVSIFNPSGGTQYEQVQGGGYNGNNGKWYFDNVAVRAATLNLNSTKEISGLKIYPNPAKNLLNITSDSFETKIVTIYNVLGAQVLAVNITNTPINVANLAKGVYVVKITEEGKAATGKLVIE